MSSERCQDFLNRSTPRHEEQEPDPWLAQAGSLERRMAERLFRLRGDEGALLGFVRELPLAQRLTARLALIRALGSPRGAATYLRAFGPGLALFPVVHEEPPAAVAPGARALHNYARARGLRDVFAGLLRATTAEPGLEGDLLTSMGQRVSQAALALLRGSPALGLARSLFAVLDERTGQLATRVAAGSHAGPWGQAATPAGTALHRATERRAATLYRREAGAGSEADPDHPAVQEALRRAGQGAPLAEPLRRQMEARLGVSFAWVRIHTDGTAAQAAQAVQARAFTVGEDIFFAQGHFAPGNRDGEQLLIHELAHVAQYALGRLPSAGARLSEPDDAVEREARALEQGMRPAAPAQPGPQRGASATLLIARDTEDQDSRQYWEDEYNNVSARGSLLASLSAVQLPSGAPYTYWLWGRNDAFVSNALLPLLEKQSYAELVAVLAPGDVDAAIRRGRGLSDKEDGKGANTYCPEVAVELHGLFLPLLKESLERLAPQYAVALYQATKPEDRQADYEQKAPPLTGLVPAHPIDKYAIQGLSTAQLYLNFKAYEESGLAGATLKVLRPVKYAFSPSSPRMVRVSEPKDPRPEEVAKALYGDPAMANSVIAAAPIFGFFPQLLTEAAFSAWRTAVGKKAEGIIRGPVPTGTDPALDLLKSASSDEAALNQAKKLPPTGASREKIIATIKTSQELIEQITANASTVSTANWGAGRFMKDKLEERVKALQAATDPTDALRWDAQALGQQSILSRTATGVKHLAEVWRSIAVVKLDDKGSAALKDLPSYLDKPMKELARAYLGVVEVCDLVEVATQRLAQAEQRDQLLPIVMVEGILAYCRGLIGGLGAGFGAGSDNLGATEMKEREQALRAKLMAARALILKDPSAAQGIIKEIQEDAADLQDEASLASSLDAIAKESDFLTSHTGTITGTITGKNQKYIKAVAKLHGWYFDKLYPIYLNYKQPTLRKEARQALRELQKEGPALQHDLNDVIAMADSEETRERWIGLSAKIAALVAITVVTAGAGEFVAGGLMVGAGWGGTAAGVLGATVLSAGAEAATFTALSTVILGQDPHKGVLASFAENWMLFGAVKGLQLLAEAAAGAGIISTTVGNVASTLGGLGGQMALSLAEADAQQKKDTGKGLSDEQVKQMIGEQLVVMIASALLMRYGPGKAFLEGAKARGEESPFFHHFETVDKARNQALRAISALNKQSPLDQAKKAVEMDSEALKQEADLLKRMQEWAEQWSKEHPGLANNLGIDPAKMSQMLGVTELQIAARERAALAGLLQHKGGNLFHCKPGELAGILARFEKLGDKVVRDPSGKAEGKVGQGNDWLRIVEETREEQAPPSATNQRLAQLRQSLSAEAQVAFDQVLKQAAAPEQALKQLEAMHQSAKGLESALLEQGEAAGKSADTGMKHETVPGLFEGVKLDGQQGKWGFETKSEVVTEGDYQTTTLTTDITLTTADKAYEGANMKRSLQRNLKTGAVELNMEMAFLKEIPQELRWVNEGGPMLQEGRGTPLQTYVSLMQMKMAKVRLGELSAAKASNVTNRQTCLQLGVLLKKQGGIQSALSTAEILTTQTGNNTRTNVEQAGGKITKAEIQGGSLRQAIDLFPGTVEEATAALKESGFGLDPKDPVPNSFDILFTLEQPAGGGAPKP